MSLLLYGIVFAEPGRGVEQPTPLPLGIGGAQVRVLEARGLAAAVSKVDSSDIAPSVERALAYAEVVEALHGNRTVLPLRYGCVLDQESDVVELLRAQGGTYAERLRGLDGCVEMGIRIPAAERGSSGAGDSAVQSAGRLGNVSGSLSGMAYLDRRKSFYAERERPAHEAAASVQQLRAALAGLSLRCKTEHSAAPGPRSIFRVPLLSLHFLVKREQLASFRAAVLRIDLTERARFLVSGPWPPYNFAVPDVQR